MAERRGRSEEQQEAWQIYKACFKDGESRADGWTLLSGTIDSSRYSLMTANVGKCSVYGMEKSHVAKPALLHLAEAIGKQWRIVSITYLYSISKKIDMLCKR